jgi:sugar O-acyltransferase (sialic acid O-acetyltransferase NeuD family)
MAKQVFIIGAGGFARETFDVYIDLNREEDVLGFLEENCKKDGEMLNGRPIHDISYFNSFNKPKNEFLLIGAMGSTKRRRLLTRLENEGFQFDTIIHKSVIKSRWVKIGAGSIITPGVIMTCQVELGRHVIVNLGVRIGHDVTIGNFTTLSPGVEIMGCAALGEQVYVGTNATVIDHVKVGNGAIIAAGAVVTKDVLEMALVAGVPAEVKKIYRTETEKPW